MGRFFAMRGFAYGDIFQKSEQGRKRDKLGPLAFRLGAVVPPSADQFDRRASCELEIGGLSR